MIETDRLLLREPRPDDAPAFASLLTDPEAMRFLGGQVPLDAVPTVVQRWIDDWRENGVGKLVVELRDGSVAGRVGINVWDERGWTQSTFAQAGSSARPELAWAFAREHWGHGYATEAAAAVRAWVRDGRRVDGELISVVNPANVASRRVAEKLGASPRETVTLFDGSPAVVWVHPS